MRIFSAIHEWLKGLPLFTAAVSLISVTAYFAGMAEYFQYDREAIAGGQLWRIFTGHLMHWNGEHLLWCSLSFIALGTVCENISKRGYVATLALSSLVLPLALFFSVPEMTSYRGLSGNASALFIFGAALHMRASLLKGDSLGGFLSLLAGLAYSGKVVFEYATGQALFVSAQNVFVPAPFVHLVGGITGVVMALCFSPAKHSRPRTRKTSRLRFLRSESC